MTTIQEAIAKHRKDKLAQTGELNSLVIQAAETIAQKVMDDLRPKLIEEVKDLLTRTEQRIMDIRESTQQEIIELRESVRDGEQGEQGEKPVAGVDYPIPKDGHTPTKQELLKLIRSLIPEPEEPPSDERLTALITPLVKEKSDTPDQIANKLNTLEEVIEQKTIKGLNVFMQSIQRAVGESRQTRMGGGGMGNVQHEQYAVNTGTVSIITSFPIAMRGNGIISARVQNADLKLTTHFTVGSDRRTLTFNSEIRQQFIDGGEFYIIYIRG